MVRIKSKLLSVTIASLCALSLATGCGSSGSGSEPREVFSPDEPSPDEGTGTHRLPEPGEEKTTSNLMHGPDIPPDGMRYDEWKGFQYTTDTEFDVRTFWTVCSEKHQPSHLYGVFQDPYDIEDGKLKIIDAKSEPVGGEMKLRSGGYVDITVEMRWSGSMRGYQMYESEVYDSSWYLMWRDTCAYPCDAYTGTSLLNSISSEDAESDSIAPGQAVDTSMVESDVTWKNRTYRLFAKSDTRNSSFESWSTEEKSDRYNFTAPCSVELTYSFRIPADYDGLVFAIDKDITDERSANIDENGDFLSFSDLYADVMTTDTGVKQTADDFYFVRVSDLLEKFADQK